MPRTGPILPAMMTSVRLPSVRSTPVSLPWTLRSNPPTSPNKTIGTTVALSPPLSGTPAADANPKHAEFIRDSPLEWYADGPINDVFADWDDEQGLTTWAGVRVRVRTETGRMGRIPHGIPACELLLVACPLYLL